MKKFLKSQFEPVPTPLGVFGGAAIAGIVFGILWLTLIYFAK